MRLVLTLAIVLALSAGALSNESQRRPVGILQENELKSMPAISLQDMDGKSIKPTSSRTAW
jgi:hypothetical protein